MWLDGTTPLIELFHLVLWTCFCSSGSESKYMLIVVFSFNCYEVYMATEDSRDVLVLPIDYNIISNILYYKQYTILYYIAYEIKQFKTDFKAILKFRFDGIPVYGAQL